MIKSLLVGLLFLACPAFSDDFRHFNDWSTKEKILFTTYSTAVYVDLMQTNKAIKHPCKCYLEANPLFGNDPSMDKILVGNLLSTGLIYYSMGITEENKLFNKLLFITALRVGVVYRNNSVGISWTAAF